MDPCRILLGSAPCVTEHRQRCQFAQARRSSRCDRSKRKPDKEGCLPSLEQVSLIAVASPAERQMHVLAENKGSKEIGVDLSISVRTVEAHRRRMVEKLDLHSMAEMIHFAIRNGIVEAKAGSESYGFTVRWPNCVVLIYISMSSVIIMPSRCSQVIPSLLGVSSSLQRGRLRAAANP
jgi:DNA-binding CsgD family transcriptional regulator